MPGDNPLLAFRKAGAEQPVKAVERLDPKDLPQPFDKADVAGFAQAQGLPHLFLHLGRDGERHLRHRIAGGEFEQQKDDQ